MFAYGQSCKGTLVMEYLHPVVHVIIHGAHVLLRTYAIWCTNWHTVNILYSQWLWGAGSACPVQESSQLLHCSCEYSYLRESPSLVPQPSVQVWG